jgi:DNA polymerase-1
MLVFDCETDGFLAVLTKIHCLAIREPGEPETLYVGHAQVEVGLRRLMEATEQGTVIAGHNVIKFDVPAMRKVYPWFKPVEPSCGTRWFSRVSCTRTSARSTRG